VKIELNGQPCPWDITVLESLDVYKKLTGREVSEQPTDLVPFAYAGYCGAMALQDQEPLDYATFKKRAKIMGPGDPL
jgi:hypothetical protein